MPGTEFFTRVTAHSLCSIRAFVAMDMKWVMTDYAYLAKKSVPGVDLFSNAFTLFAYSE